MAKTKYKTNSYPYRVYTALLTQSGGDNIQSITSGTLTIGVTYQITDDTSNPDFTNVGAPNNNLNTYFVATGTTPNSWGQAELQYNEGAPVATVLENTIGNIWFEYFGEGNYYINSNELFTVNKTTILNGSGWDVGDISNTKPVYSLYQGLSSILVQSGLAPYADDILNNTSIEIRVYS